MVRLRSALDDVPPYRAGRPAPAGARRLSANESEGDPLPSVRAAVAEAASLLHRYPDFGASGLIRTLAGRYGVPEGQVVVGTGSVAVAEQAIRAVADAGSEVIYAWRSFEAYPILTRLAGARAVEVPVLADGRHDLAAMAAAVTDETRLMILCTPNNPTGPALGTDEVRRLVASVPDDLLVLLDEAYAEYVTDPAAVDGITLLRDHPNLLVTRTFSKAYGLASLRVGWGVAADPAVAEALRKVALPFGVSGLAQVAAEASLLPAADAELRRRVAATVVARDRLAAGLRELGYDVPDAQGNFVWLPVGGDTAAVAALLEEAGLVTRPYPPDGVRITVADEASVDAVLSRPGRPPSRDLGPPARGEPRPLACASGARPRAVAVRDHHHLPLPLRAPDHRAVVPRRRDADRLGPHRQGALPTGHEVLGKALPHQRRHGRRDRHRPGVPVRHELERLLPLRR